MTKHQNEAAGMAAAEDEYGETVLSATTALWGLFFSIGASMMSMGLLGPLLAIRAGIGGFTTETTGIVMTGYFAGFLVSSQLTPKLVSRVGHVRVFAALASLASIAPLVHAMFVDPYVWFAGRVVTGFSYAGIYIVAESWLNARASNRNRGKLLSIYMVVLVGTMASGPLLLNLAHPLSMDLFILASVLVSISLIPILLAATPVPSYEEPEKLGIVALYKLAPLSVFGMIIVGLTNGALVSIAAVYGDSLGMSVAEVSLFTTAAMVGTVVTQWPIGWLSDRFDRRWVITGVTFAAAAVAVAGLPGPNLSFLVLCAVVALLGGLSLPLYSLCIAHGNDRLTTKQMMAASGSMVMLSGIGAIGGPSAISYVMGAMGPEGFFIYFIVLQGALGVFALYRMTRRAPIPLDQQETMGVAAQPAAVTPVLTPESYAEITSAADPDPASDNGVSEPK